MKPLHMVVLIAAGAIGGGVMVKLAMQPKTVTPAATMPAQTTPATAPAMPPVRPSDTLAAGAPGQDVSGKISPLETPKPVREAPKPGRTPRVIESKPEDPAIAPSQPAEPIPPAPPAPVDAAPEPDPPARIAAEQVTPPSPPPEPHKVTLNAGTMIPVRLVDGLSSERNLPGDSFTATLDKELVVDGFVIAERGARVEGRVVASDRGRRMKGVAALQVELVRLRTADGQTVALQTDAWERRAADTHRQDAETVGAGVALGAAIGALAGGGKGAAIGAGRGRRRGRGHRDGDARRRGGTTFGDAGDVPSEGSGDDYGEAAGIARGLSMTAETAERSPASRAG
jgi:hypothetical protein